jgi:uncharacterized protein YktB (UPF0637 family)
MSWDNSVGIETGYSMNFRGSITDRDKIFLLSAASRQVLGPTDTWSLFARVYSGRGMKLTTHFHIRVVPRS